MIDDKTAPYAALILRVSMGVMLLAHSALLKVFVFTPAGFAGFLGSIGLPTLLAWPIILFEIVAGIALILGVATRWVALATVPVLLGAVWVHSGNGWLFSAPNGGWEFPAFWAAALVVQALLGDGAHALRIPALSALATPQTAK